MKHTYNSDINYLIQEIKDYNRIYYISSLFVERNFYKAVILIMYLDIQLNKLIMSNAERNIVVGQFVWWKNYLILSNNNNIPMVPFFKVYYNVNNQNKLMLDKYINFIDSAEKLYLIQNDKNKRKYYLNYIKSRNKILMYILKINFNERKYNKALNLLALSAYYRSIKDIKLSNLMVDRARKYNKRPEKRDLFIYIIHLSYNEINYLILVVKSIFRYW